MYTMNCPSNYVLDLSTFVLSLRNYLVFISLFSSPFLWTACFNFSFYSSLMVCVFLMTEKLPKAITSISVGRLCPSPWQAALPDPCGP